MPFYYHFNQYKTATIKQMVFSLPSRQSESMPQEYNLPYGSNTVLMYMCTSNTMYMYVCTSNTMHMYMCTSNTMHMYVCTSNTNVQEYLYMYMYVCTCTCTCVPVHVRVYYCIIMSSADFMPYC